MSINFELAKSVEFQLEKIGIKDLTSSVSVVLDVSYSTKRMFEKGIIQKALNVISHVAFKLDDNNNLDSFIFGSTAEELEGITPKNYENYIQKEVIESNRNSLWTGTYYSTFIKEVIKFYFEEKEEEEKPVGFVGFIKSLFKKEEVVEEDEIDYPKLCLIITDGETSDGEQSKRLIELHKDKNIFWQFIGVGIQEHFQFIKDLADKHSNVGFSGIQQLESQSNESLLESLLSNKFSQWVK